jgi:hypothetical protein
VPVVLVDTENQDALYDVSGGLCGKQIARVRKGGHGRALVALGHSRYATAWPKTCWVSGARRATFCGGVVAAILSPMKMSASIAAATRVESDVVVNASLRVHRGEVPPGVPGGP